MKDWLQSTLSTHTARRLEDPRWQPVIDWLDTFRGDEFKRRVWDLTAAARELLSEAEERGCDLETFHAFGQMIEAVPLMGMLGPLRRAVEARRLYAQPNGANLHMIALRTLDYLHAHCGTIVDPWFWAGQPEDVKRRWPGLIHTGIQRAIGRTGLAVIREAVALDREAQGCDGNVGSSKS